MLNYYVNGSCIKFREEGEEIYSKKSSLENDFIEKVKLLKPQESLNSKFETNSHYKRDRSKNSFKELNNSPESSIADLELG